MKTVPLELKITIVIAIMVVVTVVVFLIFITVLYNRRQTLFQKERMLKEMEYRTQLLQKEIDFQNKAKEEQERISHDMHDDLGAGISAIKLQAEFIKHKVSDPEIRNDVQELLRSCADLSGSLRQVLWNIKPGNDHLQDFTDYVIQYAHTFFAKSDIKVYTFKDEVGYDLISADKRRNLFLCVKEILNNIYKHSEAENVTLHFKQTGRSFYIDIKDDGIGLKADTAYGNGLQNMRSRMEGVCGKFSFLPVDKGLHICLKVDIESTITENVGDLHDDQ
ncbi:sensor histidine kinase [Kaistella palustris]|uniref:sensor histidine kinase n=1 Tax=Kaistella palustris TaxID=493376 RepID=UPI00041D0C8E|nr:histidine kinase [Kaistella palustris]